MQIYGMEKDWLFTVRAFNQGMIQKSVASVSLSWLLAVMPPSCKVGHLMS